MKPLRASRYLCAAAAVSGLASAGTPVLTGHTTATANLTPDIRKGVDLPALLRLNCSHLDSIMAGRLPGDFDPKKLPQVPAGLLSPPEGLIENELWTAVGCGRSAPIIVRLRRTNTGKDTFDLTPLSKRGGPNFRWSGP